MTIIAPRIEVKMKKLLALGIGTAFAFFSLAKPATSEWNKSTLVLVSDGLDVFWGTFLGKLGVQYRYPVVYSHANTSPTPCGMVRLAHYCPATNTIHLEMGEMSQLAFEIGDSAAYFAVAHEYGHSVQRHMGLLNKGIPIPVLELQADCLAGTFFAATKYAGVLETGDLEEGMFSAFKHGDYQNWRANHHGTPEQRMAAFTIGFTDPRACFE